MAISSVPVDEIYWLGSDKSLIGQQKTLLGQQKSLLGSNKSLLGLAINH